MMKTQPILGVVDGGRYKVLSLLGEGVSSEVLLV